MRLTDAMRSIHSMCSWSGHDLFELHRQFHSSETARALIRYVADLRELNTDDDLELIKACVRDGWAGGPIPTRLGQLKRMEVLEDCAFLGPVSDRPREKPALDFDPSSPCADERGTEPMPLRESAPSPGGGGVPKAIEPVSIAHDPDIELAVDIERRVSERE